MVLATLPFGILKFAVKLWGKPDALVFLDYSTLPAYERDKNILVCLLLKADVKFSCTYDTAIFMWPLLVLGITSSTVSDSVRAFASKVGIALARVNTGSGSDLVSNQHSIPMADQVAIARVLTRTKNVSELAWIVLNGWVGSKCRHMSFVDYGAVIHMDHAIGPLRRNRTVGNDDCCYVLQITIQSA
jgi:hypothetical protein